MNSRTTGSHSAGSHSKPSHSAPRRRRKRVNVKKIVTAVLLIAVIGLAVVFVPKLISRLGSRQEEPEIIEETPEPTPEPVDLREYDVSFPESDNEAISLTLESMKDSIVSEFDGKHDGSEPALLEASYVSGTSEDVFNFILTVRDGEEEYSRTVCISEDGTVLDNLEVLGERSFLYLKDYINIVLFTEGAYINERGVIILPQDIPEAISDDSANYELFLLDSEGGAVFYIPAEAIAEDMQPVEVPMEVKLSSPKAAVPVAEEAPADDSEPAPSVEDETATPDEGTETAAEEAAPVEAPVENEDVSTEAPVEIEPLEAPYFSEDGVLNVPVNSAVLSGVFYGTRRIYPDKPMVALTFDDGPNSDSSLRILDCLDANHAVATFFEVGKNVEKYPEVSQRVVASGHELGSHSYGHLNMLDYSYDAVLFDKQKSDEVFTAAVGFIPGIVRPPEGVTGNGPFIYDQPFIGWSVDTLDWLSKNPTQIINTVQTAGNLDGHVILMHSIYGTSADAAEVLVPWLQEQGYQLVTISELMEYCYRVEMEGHYYYAFDYFKHGRPDYSEQPAEG